MPDKRSRKKRKHVSVGAIVEPGVGTLYVRGAWMKKLDDLGKRRKRKRIRKGRVQKK